MYIKINEANYPCSGYQPINGTVRFIGVEGLTLPISGTVFLYSEDGDFELVALNSENFARQIYRDNILTITNEPETATSELELARFRKRGELDGTCSFSIFNGLDLACSEARGVMHYSFPETAQRAITIMVQAISFGETLFMYKSDSENYNPYTANEIKILFKAMGDWISANVNYYEMLKKWINRETEIATLESISYGSSLPQDLIEELQNNLTSVGIDWTKYASKLSNTTT